MVKILRLLLDRKFEAEFWTSKLKFGQDFEADVWFSFLGLSLVEIMKLNFDKLSIWPQQLSNSDTSSHPASLAWGANKLFFGSVG